MLSVSPRFCFFFFCPIGFSTTASMKLIHSCQEVGTVWRHWCSGDVEERDREISRSPRSRSTARTCPGAPKALTWAGYMAWQRKREAVFHRLALTHTHAPDGTWSQVLLHGHRAEGLDRRTYSYIPARTCVQVLTLRYCVARIRFTLWYLIHIAPLSTSGPVLDEAKL